MLEVVFKLKSKTNSKVYYTYIDCDEFVIDGHKYYKDSSKIYTDSETRLTMFPEDYKDIKLRPKLMEHDKNLKGKISFKYKNKTIKDSDSSFADAYVAMKVMND